MVSHEGRLLCPLVTVLSLLLEEFSFLLQLVYEFILLDNLVLKLLYKLIVGLCRQAVTGHDTTRAILIFQIVALKDKLKLAYRNLGHLLERSAAFSNFREQCGFV